MKIKRKDKLQYWSYYVVTHLLWKHIQNLHTKLFTQYLQGKLTLQIKMTYLPDNGDKNFLWKFY